MNVTDLERAVAERLAEHIAKRFGSDGIEVVADGGRVEVRVTNQAAVVAEFGDQETPATPWVYGLVDGSKGGS